MNRRDFLQCAAVLVGGVSVSELGFALSNDQRVYLASAPDYIAGKANYFSPAQRELISAMAEVIIPRTETPGAIDAGVPKFIELMVQDWFTDEERAIFDTGLKAVETRVPQVKGKPFNALTAAEQLAIMEKMEADASSSPWYIKGNVRRPFISDAPFICQLKELTIWGFFTSEVGSKQVLRYEPMPMKFDGHTPRKPGDTTWAPNALFR